MIELLIKLVEQLNGAVFVLVVILIVAFWATYKLSGIISLFGGFKEERTDLKLDIKTIKNDLSNVSATVKLLYDIRTIQTNSPISLSELGQTISSDLFLSTKVDNYWDQIKPIIASKNPSNPYDVQTIALDNAKLFFDKFFDANEKDVLKTYAYQKGLNVLQIYPIIGVHTRDRYLREEGMKVDDIDTYAPPT